MINERLHFDPVGLSHLRRAGHSRTGHNNFGINFFRNIEAGIKCFHQIQIANLGKDDQRRRIGDDVHTPSRSIDCRSS